MNYFKNTLVFGLSIVGTLLLGNVFGLNALAQDPIVSVGGDETGVFDWTEANRIDADGWNNGTATGTSDNLVRVYYHEPSGKYVKVSVKSQFRWNGGYNDPHPYAPKIISEARNGTGGFDQTDMFLFNSIVRNGEAQNNSFTIEFFEDADLTQKASVSNLNFTLTDLDSGRRRISGVQITGREKIDVNAVGTSGESVPVQFYRPQGSLIEDSWINNGTVLGYESNITNEFGNIAPIITGETHKVEITYSVEVSPPNNSYSNTRNMYVSDLAWGGYTVQVTPDEEVELPELPPEEQNTNNAPTPADDDVSSYAWKDSVIDVVANDIDPDNENEVLTITQINGQDIEPDTAIEVDGGQVIVNRDNQIEYYSNNVPGQFTFEYSVTDSEGAIGSATVNMLLKGYAD